MKKSWMAPASQVSSRARARRARASASFWSVERPEVQPAGPIAHRGGLREVLRLPEVGFELHPAVRVLGEAARGGQEEAPVARGLEEQAFHGLEAERDGLPDQVGIVVRS